MIIGYTTGVFDLFHIGHLNLLRRASCGCDFLIVGVSTDEVVKEYKGHAAVIPLEDRLAIVRSIEHVDRAVMRPRRDIVYECRQEKSITHVFVGDDWRGTERWETAESELKTIGVKVVWLPYTKRISTTEIKKRVLEMENMNGQ